MKKLTSALSLVACLFGSTGSAQTVAPVGPMVTYEIKAPNGKTYEVQAKQGASQLEIAQAVVKQHPESNIARPAAAKTVTYEVKAPDGKTYDIDAPVGTPLADLKHAVLVKHPDAGIAIKKKAIEVELADGRVIKFPAGTDLGEVKETIKVVLAETAIGSKSAAGKQYDLSTMSHADLDAILAGNMAGVSDAGRLILANQGAQIAPGVPTPAITGTTAAANIQPATPPTPPNNSTQDHKPDLVMLAAPLVIGVLFFAGLIWGALALNGKHQRKRPNCRPFAWGYYNALSGFLAPFFVAGAVRNNGIDVTSLRVLLTLLILMYFPLAILTLRRSRLGFLLLTILSLNPIFWIINGIYLKNRWQELAPNRGNRTEPEATEAAQSPNMVASQNTASASSDPINDEALYEQALTELNTDKKPGIWAMALAQTANGGNPDGVYIALRVKQLRGESPEHQQSPENGAVS